MEVLELFELGMDRVIYPTDWSGSHPKLLIGHRINLGGGTKQMPAGVENVGREQGYDADFDMLPFEADTVAEIFALHFLEHLSNVNRVLADCQRVLRVGGLMHIVVPYGTCHMAVQDLDHKHFFNEDSWRHTFANPYYNPWGEAWEFEIIYNMIMGVKGENLALVTQLRKRT
jgi:predicted SAM-dependent methyltransferase